MMNTRYSIHLPEDLLEEILSRVPASSLARLKSTSKRWNALIKDGRFAKKHSACAPRQSPFVIELINFRVHLVSVNHNDMAAPCTKITYQFSLKERDNSLEEVNIRNVVHCNGLLLCTTEDNRLVVWNPCLRETRWIQPTNPYKQFDLSALGYDKSYCYKVLCLVHNGYPYQTTCEVYDFVSNSWSAVGVITDWYIWSARRGVSVKGNTYWIAHSQVGLSNNFLLCFDFSTERFRSLSLPGDALRYDYREVALSVTREEQQLMVMCIYGCEVDVWIASKMESTGDTSWSKFHRFNSRIRLFVLADIKKKVFVCCNKPTRRRDVSNTLHIVGEDEYIQVDDHRGESKCPLLLTYVPSFVQI